MKVPSVKVSRVAATLILLLSLIPVSPLPGLAATPALAAEAKWILQDKDTKVPLATFQKDVPQPDGSLWKYDVTTSGTTLYYHTQTVKAGKVTSESTYTWTFGQPPRELTPGQTIDLTIQGKVSGNVGALGVPARYTYHADYVENFRDTSADEIANLRLNTTSPNLSGVLRFTVPPAPPIGRGGQITLVAEVPTIQNVVGTPGQFVWIYRVPEETPPASPTEELSLKFYHPFEYFRPGSSRDISPAGDLLATLKNNDPGQIPDRIIVFYVDQETPDKFLVDPSTNKTGETGKNLYEVLQILPNMGDRPPVVIRDQPPGRKFLGWARTDRKGEARLIYLSSWSFDPKKFSSTLGEQRFIYLDRGRVSGTIWAAVYNKETERLEPATSVEVEFKGMAQILEIYGEGRPDNTETGKKYPGRVRVKRALAIPEPEYEQVPAGFLLMPGDLVNQDGNTIVEIAWVTGDKIRSRLPDKKWVGDAREPWEPSDTTIVMLSSAYDSGFRRDFEITRDTTFGFGMKKGAEVIVESIPWVGKLIKEGYELVVELQEALGEVDLKKIDIKARVRIRSKLLLDSTGDDLKIYNIEGAPDIKTVTGEEVTLANGKMVAVSADGKLGSPQTFDVKAVENAFNNGAGAAPGSPTATGKSSALPYAVGAGVLLMIIVIAGILRKKKTA